MSQLKAPKLNLANLLERQNIAIFSFVGIALLSSTFPIIITIVQIIVPIFLIGFIYVNGYKKVNTHLDLETQKQTAIAEIATIKAKQAQNLRIQVPPALERANQSILNLFN